MFTQLHFYTKSNIVVTFCKFLLKPKKLTTQAKKCFITSSNFLDRYGFITFDSVVELTENTAIKTLDLSTDYVMY